MQSRWVALSGGYVSIFWQAAALPHQLVGACAAGLPPPRARSQAPSTQQQVTLEPSRLPSHTGRAADRPGALQAGRPHKRCRLEAGSASNGVQLSVNGSKPVLDASQWDALPLAPAPSYPRSRASVPVPNRLRIFSGTANPVRALCCVCSSAESTYSEHQCVQMLAQEVACYLGLPLSNIKVKRFADGEIYVQVQVGRHAYLQACSARSN